MHKRVHKDINSSLIVAPLALEERQLVERRHHVNMQRHIVSHNMLERFSLQAVAAHSSLWAHRRLTHERFSLQAVAAAVPCGPTAV